MSSVPATPQGCAKASGKATYWYLTRTENLLYWRFRGATIFIKPGCYCLHMVVTGIDWQQQ